MLFDELNAAFFHGQLPFVEIFFGIQEDLDGAEDHNGNTRLKFLTKHDMGPVLLSIAISEWFLKDSWKSDVVRWRMVTDTLLHEMVHVAVHLDALGGLHPFEDGHEAYFAAECNRIGIPRGWIEVVPHSEVDLDYDDGTNDAAEWPDHDAPLTEWPNLAAQLGLDTGDG